MQQQAINYSSLTRRIGYWEAEQVLQPGTPLSAIKTRRYVRYGALVILPWLYAFVVYLPNDPQADELVAVASLAGWYAFLVVLHYIFHGSKKQQARLVYFAKDNDFTYTETETIKELGVFSEIGKNRRYTDIIAGSYNKKSFTICNLTYVTGSGKSEQEHKVGVVEVTLPKKLPNIFLDSKANDFVQGFGLSRYISGSQKLSLEGNFDDYFTLYAPANYERDALYFLTPELMALLVDKGSDFDFEIIGNTLKFYKTDGFTHTQAQYELLFKLIDSLGGEFIENTARYADDKSAVQYEVVREGRELSANRLPKIIIWVFKTAITVAIILIMLWSVIFSQ